METVGGHPRYRVTGDVADSYGATGRQVNAHRITVWIDADSLLIRKVLEEWKPLPGQVSRTTTLFEPQANPALDESRFRFAPPTAQ